MDLGPLIYYGATTFSQITLIMMTPSITSLSIIEALHNGIQHYDTQRNVIRYSINHHDDTQYNNTQHIDTQHAECRKLDY
jgi:hypothetical protein